MMSPSAQAAFDGWINTETWHTRHSFDDQRFFRFVWAVIQEGDPRPSAADIEQEILAKWHGRLAEEYLDDRARHYADLYFTLCDFADQRPH
jgi:hypothetical protein